MKKVLLVIGIVFALIVAAFVGLCHWAGSELKPHVDMLMSDSNRERYEEAYARTSKPFRETTTLEAFRGFLEARKKAFGDYVELGTVTGFATHVSSEKGTQGTLKLDMAFQKGSHQAEFTFVKEDGDWKLLNMTIEIPKAGPDPVPPAAEKSDPGGG